MQRGLERSEVDSSASPDGHPENSVGDVHIRNHDHDRGYDLKVVVTDDEHVLFAERCYVPPGRTRSLHLYSLSGTYELVVTLDQTRTEREMVRLDRDPTHSALIECGNGTVTVTQGVY